MTLPRTYGVIEQGIRDGLHLGCQLYISHRHQLITDTALGEARPGEPLTPDHLTLWLSAGKPLAAIAIAQLWEQNLLDIDDPVAKHLPDFAQRGKDAVTIRHLLTHTAGFRGVAASWTPLNWDPLIARICASPLEPGWIPGQKAGYHVASSWYILAEIIRRLSGLPYEHYIRERIYEPLGIHDVWCGMDDADYHANLHRLAPLYITENGKRDHSYPGNSKDSITSCRPGAGARGPIRHLARLYETLLSPLPHVPTPPSKLLSPITTAALTARHRTAMHDLTFKHTMDWTLGFAINSRHYSPDVPYNFGPHASTRTFGHGGSQSSSAFADPDHHLVVAFTFNGLPGEAAHQARLNALTAAIYEDLHLGAQ